MNSKTNDCQLSFVEFVDCESGYRYIIRLSDHTVRSIYDDTNSLDGTKIPNTKSLAKCDTVIEEVQTLARRQLVGHGRCF